MNINRTVTRRYDIDWLRNLSILLLFPFHTARVFDYWEPFYSKNEELSWGLSWFIFATSYWFMPLLFLLAGSSSWYALNVKSGKEYIHERFQRLFIPLLFGIILIIPPQGYVAVLSSTQDSINYGQFLKNFFTDFTDLTGYFGTFTPGHLWFILFLFVLSLVALPLFLYLKKEKTKDKISQLADFLSKPWVFLLLFIPITLMEALPAPGGKNPFYFLFIFIIGFILCTDQRYLEVIHKLKRQLFWCLLLLVPALAVMTSLNLGAEKWSPISITLAMMKNLALWLTLIVFLGYGHQYLNRKSKWMSYLNEAAFPLYILHQTILVIVAYFIVQFNIPIFVKFLAIMCMTLVICLLLYELLIRRISSMRWMFGVKRAKN